MFRCDQSENKSNGQSVNLTATAYLNFSLLKFDANAASKLDDDTHTLVTIIDKSPHKFQNKTEWTANNGL